MSAFGQTMLTLEPDRPMTRLLRSDETHRYKSAISGDLRVIVENLGRGTILTACRLSCASDDAVLLRSANWRGPEHFYSAVLSVDEETIFEIAPDEDIAPAGEYRISAHAFSPDDDSYAGERLLTLGADRHLKHYFGEADAREEASTLLKAAARSFEVVENAVRRADALFEAGVVQYELGRTQLACESFIEAEAIWQSLGDDRGLASSENQRGLVVQLLGGNTPAGCGTSAVELFEQAAMRREALGDDFFYAQAVNNLGLIFQELGDGRLALRYFREALTIWQGSVDLMTVDLAALDFSELPQEPWLHYSVIAMGNLGWAYDHSALPALAEQHYGRAMDLAQWLERGEMRARISNNYGELMYRLGKLQSALSLLQEAIGYFESSGGNEVWAAEAHKNLGLVYAAVGDSERARLSFQESLRLRTPERDPVGRAETLRHIGMLEIESGNLTDSLATVDEALESLGASRVGREERAGLEMIAGLAHSQSGNFAEALDRYNRSVELYEGIMRRDGEATARANRANAYHAIGNDVRALAEFDAALELTRQIESLDGQFRILTMMARARLDRGESDVAFDIASEAINLSERLREQLLHPALLREYASVQRDAYDVLIGAAIESGRREEAWQAADRARGSRFTELLRQSGAALAALAPSAREHFETLRERLALLAVQRSDFLARGEADRADAVHRELLPLLNELDALSIDAQSGNGQRDAWPDLRAVQAALGPGDLLLEYHLSPLGAGVWRIGARSLTYERLPDVDEIEDSIVALSAALRDSANMPDAEIRNLSAQLFSGDSRMDDDVSHLIVVPDGSLYTIPFALLRDPSRSADEPLIASTEITYLPSASALLELRQRDDSGGSGIAVLADPVFEASDPRIGVHGDVRDQAPPPLVAGIVRRGSPYRDRYTRLPGTREESRAIRDAAGAMDVRLILDTDANRGLVLSGALDDYRILHFATHGVLDVEEPAISGLVLSAVAEDGRPRSPFLLAQDIVSMSLKAELVVLSGCDTGFGRSVRGEGLISLSRAFFYAGAEQVISSLWPVPDRATAELMRVFYRRLLQEGDSPALALRNAQLSVMRNPRWRNPYFWAAFTLQGDWAGGNTA
jgi:CHAT domain-containing protein/tetratricopeptide (TPR) repeat protein